MEALLQKDGRKTPADFCGSGSIAVVVALLLVLPACSFSSRKAAPKAREPVRVSLVELRNTGGGVTDGGFNAVVFEDLTGVVAASFGGASVVPTVDDALANKSDIIVFLSIRTEMASQISPGASIDVYAKFTDRQEILIEQFQIHSGQRAGPFQQPHQINDGVRAHARAQLQQAILTSPKLSRLVMVRPASPQAVAPQTDNGAGKKEKGKVDSKKDKKRGKARIKVDDLS